MAAKVPSRYTPLTSDAAVRAKTGRTWDEWFALLDAAGAAKLSHREIAAIVRDRFGVGPWWQQQVTVTYEQARGLREKHQTPSGYQASISRTMNVPATKLFKAWEEPRLRARWLGGGSLTIRKATPGKSLRITWSDGTTVDVGFYPKGAAKTQVAVQHGKLPSAAAVKRQKAFWARALEALKEQLEP